MASEIPPKPVAGTDGEPGSKSQASWARLIRSCGCEPYRGDTDGLPTALRKEHPAERYRGVELEVNQAFLSKAGWRAAGEALAATLAGVLAGRR